MTALLMPENVPFLTCLALVALLVLIQAIGLGDVLSDTELADPGVDTGDGLLSLLGFGRLPLLVSLSSFLACFGLSGLSLQQLVTNLFGGPLQVAAASGAALLIALPVNAALMRGLSAIWPHDETTAVPIEMLLGRRGTISIGRARRGSPARASVRDRHGQVHHVMVEPHDDGGLFVEGDEVLMVRRDGELFFAIDCNGPIKLRD